MSQVPELITQASRIAGGDKQLADLLSVPAPSISMWKKETRPCPPEDQARLARIAGLDPLQALVVAHLERHAGTPKGAALLDVLGEFISANEKAPDELHQGLNWRKRRDSNPR